MISSLIRVPSVPLTGIPSVAAAVMEEVERRAVEDFGISLPQMMEQAGSHLAALVGAWFDGDLRELRIVVAVGPGDNGGGGLVAARHLANRGASVRVVLARPVLRMAPAARDQLATLVAMGADCCVATYDLADPALDDALARADLVVDAVLGYRLAGPPHDEVDRLIGSVNRAGRPVISLDLPSGVDPDSGLTTGHAITAVATLALALPKPALLDGPGAAHAGRLYLADIGLPTALYGVMGIRVGAIFSAGRIIELERPR